MLTRNASALRSVGRNEDQLTADSADKGGRGLRLGVFLSALSAVYLPRNAFPPKTPPAPSLPYSPAYTSAPAAGSAAAESRSFPSAGYRAGDLLHRRPACQPPLVPRDL